MIVEELETGLFLDRPLQEFIERFTVTKISDYLLVDDLHADENLKFFSLLTYKVTPLKHKTIYNPPLGTINSGTDSTNNSGTGSGTGVDVVVPEVGTIQYRLSFYNYKGYTFIRIKNITANTESFSFKRKDLDYWNNVINQIKKDFYN